MRKHELIFKIISILLLTWSGSALGQTKLFLRDSLSPLGTIAMSGDGYGCYNGSNDFTYYLANTTQGSSSVSQTFAPTSTNSPCQGQSADGGGRFLMWTTAPLSAAFNITGNVDFNAYCGESTNSANFAMRYVLKRWSAKSGGIVSTIHTSVNTAECTNGSPGAKAIASAALDTPTNFDIGDRLVILIEVLEKSASSWGGNSSRTYTFAYDGLAAATGDSFVNLSGVTLTFSSDSANGRAVVN